MYQILKIVQLSFKNKYSLNNLIAIFMSDYDYNKSYSQYLYMLEYNKIKITYNRLVESSIEYSSNPISIRSLLFLYFFLYLIFKPLLPSLNLLIHHRKVE